MSTTHSTANTGAQSCYSQFYMEKSFILLIVTITTDYSAGDSITPLSDVVHVLEGNNVTLSCNYSGTVSSIQWYRQYSRSKPEYLLLILESTGKVQEASPPNPHLSAKVHKKNNTVDLKFSSTALTDSAMYYCPFQLEMRFNRRSPCCRRKKDRVFLWNVPSAQPALDTGSTALLDYSAGDSIIPLSDVVHVFEGNNVTLSCNYSGSANSFLWYRQYSRSNPEFLLLRYESSDRIIHATPPFPHLSVILDKGNNRVDLKFSSTALTDSAMYYCALRPTKLLDKTYNTKSKDNTAT
ncbi:uncharacterized protein LOC114909470 [Scleropages formosus]|uniref:uncharacterized protein LOC114909470 n=1 Tax=Scleropages formosus TaxID=113540 RepID=UPI0010FABD45|nr:uncharacterized protein LOC114909470 [Scleropages formosus]